MPSVRTRQKLIDYCLRSLGSPVIEVNVDDAKKLAQLITDFTNKNLIFEGNSAPNTTEKSLKNWKELFDYILKR